MNEVITNALGGLVMLYIIVLFTVYLAIAKDVPRWHRWTYRAICWIAMFSIIYHILRLWY